MGNENLPMKVNNNRFLTIENRRNIKRIQDALKKVGKIALNGTVAVAGLVATALGGPVIATLGMGTAVVSATNAIRKMIYKGHDDLMFITREDISRNIYIFQDITNFMMLGKMSGYERSEKAALMGVQTLIGLQRYKQEFADKKVKTIPSQNGDLQLYPKVFFTETHSVNLKNFEALEQAGYIEIDTVGDTKESLLIAEKLGFGQFAEAKEAIKAAISRDKEKRNEHQVMMSVVRFRLTDKAINLEELYEEYLQGANKRARERTPREDGIRRLGIMLRALRKRNIDIKTDELGMQSIDYHAETSFAERKSRELGYANRKEEFTRRIQETAVVENQVENEQEKEQSVLLRSNREVEDEGR